MSLVRSLVSVSGMTLISRILGFARDLVIARAFGAGLATDAFFVAFRLPNLLRRLFAEGAFSQAFVPVLAEYKNGRGFEATRALVARAAGSLGLILLLVAGLGVAAAPLLVKLTAPGYSGPQFDLTVSLLRVVFPYILFISLVALAAGVLNTYGRFAAPALAPALLNVCMIAAALWLAPMVEPPVAALAWAVVAGGVLQLAWQLPFLYRLGLLPRPRLGFGDVGVRRILKLMGPALLGVSVAQISLVINTIFASFLPTGSVSWLYFADRLMEFPTGLLGVALGTVLLPSLAKYHASGAREDYLRLLDWGLRLTLMLALPAAVALALLSVPLTATLYFYGEFGAHDLWMTRDALAAYSVGLVGLILIKVLAPGFYARQDVKTPVRIAIVSLVTTQLLNLLLVGTLKHVGLALSISLGALLNAGLLYWQLRRQGIFQPRPGWGKFLLRLTLALVVMAGVLFLGSASASVWLRDGLGARGLRLTLLVAAGGISYFATLWVVGLRPAQWLRKGTTGSRQAGD